MKIVGIGNPVFDYIKTPVVDTRTRVLSGCSTNACLAARRLGAETTLIGCVGEDFAATFDAALKRYRIAAHVYPSPETGGFSLVYYDALGNRHLDVLGRAAPIPSIPEGVVEAADYVIVGPILGEVSADLLREVRQAARGRVLLDPQGMLRRIGADGRIEHYRNAEIEAIAPLCDVIKANEVEAETITGINPRAGEGDLRRATQALQRLGCQVAIVTMAADGSAAFDGDHYTRIPAFATNAIDPTGAGDTYAAGFVVGYLRYGSLKEACYYGSCVASVMVEHVGPDFPLTAREADRRFELLMRDGSG